MLAAPFLVLATSARAADWPQRAIRLICPYPPGGITDIASRLIAAELQAALGQPVVVENRAGASGSIGVTAAGQASPDGYTIVMGTNATFGTNPSTFASLTYDPIRGFEPIVAVARGPLIVLVANRLPVRSMQELVDYAKARPGEVTYGSPGIGAPVHLTTALLGSLTRTELVHVPYRGSAPALSDLAAGHLAMMIDNFPSGIALARSGGARALAITSRERSVLAPEIPTVAEALGIEFEAGSWVALMAPAGTSPAIVVRLNAEGRKALESEALRERFAASWLEPMGGSSTDLAELIRREIAQWRGVAQRAGITPQNATN
ncbi:tripartite tricarboxylate transporter substrate binding protein [Roseococcus sp. SYP-B2431]|uniref:Bug family tripartite tricarboxylate transporter substrate binding protein n=1 Tax=Roseococcus sp. SYP-B2431 TaxID=2496640 RepID=UPI0013F4A9D1|nr:tripartite tricarboxylate transporter substrate binding protein [Roseococcus sp. SYP-B2431]